MDTEPRGMARMGIDRWKQEHRAYRPDRPRAAEVTDDDRLLDVPEDLPIQPEAPSRRRAKAGVVDPTFASVLPSTLHTNVESKTTRES